MSTKVAIAGLAAKAGSPLKALTNKGKKAPINVELITCIAIDKAITKEI